MADLIEFFTTDHRRCDALWADLETAVDSGDLGQAAALFEGFYAAMNRHLDMEETVLFPAFEAASGMSGGGPTFVMRREHDQMRGVLRQMAGAAAIEDFDEVVDQGDTLLMLIQQHNLKEEGMLYPMAEMHLAGRWAELEADIQKQWDFGSSLAS